MTSQADQALSVLEDTASLLKKIQVNLKKCPKERLSKPGYLQTRIQTIEEYWHTFKKAHQDLLKCTTREQRAVISYFVNDEFCLQEDLYMCMLGDLKDLLATQTTKTADHSTCSVMSCEGHTRVKLPSIKLPTFSGNYEEWPTYKDLFVSLIHECAKLSDVEKLHYLKSSIAGEAASLLKHIQVTGANYMQAWETLNHRYNNKRLIVNALLKRLFALKKCNTQSAQQLKTLLDTTTEIINSLNNLKVSTNSWDPLIIFLVVQKLDSESHKDWEEAAYSVNSEELSTWEKLREFLEAKFRMLELINPTTTTTKNPKERVFHVTTTSEKHQDKTCALCKEVHTLYHCSKFNKMKINDRREHVKSNKLCFNCLAAGHTVFKCRMPTSCRICKRRHHTLLHQPMDKDESSSQADSHAATSSQADVEEEKVHHAVVASHHISGQKMALLATAVVILKSNHGITTVLKAIIDSGSQACFISEKATQILKLHKSPVNATVSGMEAMKAKVKHEVEFQLLSRWAKDFKLPIKAYVMSKHLTANVPSRTIMKTEWPHLSKIQLADEDYFASGTIDLLLGVNEYAAILKRGLIKGPPGTPCAQNTHLGWILMGGTSERFQEKEKTTKVFKQEVNIDDLLKTIWEVDLDTKRSLTLKEQQCEDIYSKTHRRDKDGKYIVKLPFNTDHLRSPEGNTREIAKRRLEQLERRFIRNKELCQEYTEVMNEYIELKHMEEVPVNELGNKSVYLPHHAVVRSDKESTKTRVVFDASCKGSNGISLNDELLSGPVLQDDLRSLIIRWRTHAVCFISDIQKMYRMIWVDKADTDLQRILWRNNVSQRIKDYRLLTVTFGTASAPYLAIKTLLQLADDEGSKYPEAATILREDLYVDDVMSGCDNVKEAVRISQDLKELLGLGGFQLKKWASNSRDFMETIDPNERSSNVLLKLNIDGIVKALGIQWNIGMDQLEYKLSLPPASNIITKRNILSDIQKLFDPLGWIAPSLVMAKILIQQLWQEKVGWDEPLNQTLSEKWITMRSDLENVNEISIKRWMNTTNKDNIEIHGFSDASVQAYGTVVYCRVLHSDGTVTSSIIAARTRVAPLKTISLPRLELCGALLLSRLLKQIQRAMRIPTSQIYAWTDSSIVISWLFGDTNKWKPFVANRVVEITTNLNCNQWHHVQSKDNPADIASRGMTVENLKKCDMWWNGPYWLRQPKIQFTKSNIKPTELEMRKNIVQSLKVTNIEDEGRNKLCLQFENFDTLKELLRTITYCRRFLKQKELQYNLDKIMTTEELRISLHICLKRAQEEEFKEEIDRLNIKKTVKKCSKIKFLNPYLDEAGVLRVGGRLRHSGLVDESKHPIILGRNTKLTHLIVAEAHAKTLHGGIQLMLTYLRSKYWILRAKALVKQYIHRCLVCAKLNAKVRTQVMGDLPSVRVKPARAFLNSGVDFAGPIQILTTKGRGARTSKAYIAIFVCLATKAIHLELVSDLSSAAFISAFKRFCARRGRCTNIWSDQGRNFVAANKELSAAWKEASLQLDGEIADLLANDGTQWHFIPPYSPTFGGLWEAGVKSIKYHLKRILTTNLTFEEMTTVLCEIEACLNSRPLCPMDDDSMQPLTPGHFLITEPPVIVPDQTMKDIKMSTLTRWQYTRKLVNDFWTRWKNEYLTRLQQRPKWLKRQDEFMIGDIVLVKQDNLPPGKWNMGRITEKHPGPDGFTRVYSVKTGDHITRRCITKLCPLPINTDTN